MRGKKILGALFATAVLCSFIPKNVYAQGSVNVTADKESCENGEAVSVTISATADEGSAVPPQISVEYNSNRLSFDNCSTEYGGGGGGLITINDTDATIDFTTLSGGDATINVTAVLDEDSTDVQTASVVISVAGEDTAAGTDDVGSSSLGVEASTIDTGDGRVVQTVFADEFMPVLFIKSTTDYQGQPTECASFSMGNMALLYTTDAMGNDGKFCIYNSATGELSDFRMIQGIENRFIIVLSECEGEIPSGYTKAVLDWNGQTLTAYMDTNASNEMAFAGVNPSDFFLVYGLSSEGTKGWYQYDQAEGTYQRFLQYEGAVSSVVNDGNDSESTEEGIATIFDDYISRQVQTILLIVFLALVLILLIVVIVLAVKCSEYGGYEYVDPDDYYAQDPYEGTGEPYRQEQPTVKKKSVTAASVAYESMNEDEEGEEDEEDETIADTTDDAETEAVEEVADEDEGVIRYEDDEYFSPHMSKKEAKAREKEQRRLEKEALKEEKWRAKEEKKARKMRERGYEEASPMDWSNFSEDMDSEEDSRRPMGKSSLPKYMMGDEEVAEEDVKEVAENIEDEVTEVIEEKEEKLPARRINPELSERREQESLKALKEDELRQKQKRLFEQQQRIEEQRRIEEEQKALEQKKEQEKFILNQQPDEDLDEDFQFEFLKF